MLVLLRCCFGFGFFFFGGGGLLLSLLLCLVSLVCFTDVSISAPVSLLVAHHKITPLLHCTYE